MVKKNRDYTKKRIEEKKNQRKTGGRKDYVDEAGPDTYDVTGTLTDINPDAIGSSDVDEQPGDTTTETGDTGLPANIKGHGVGVIAGGEIGVELDTGGGTTGGGGNQGADIGIDGITDVGDADPSAGPNINANTDGTIAGQAGHQGIDEGTD